MTIQHSSIVNNSAYNGGGIVSNGTWMAVQATTIGQNLARSDTNCGDGGGVATINGSWKFEISNVIVDGNDAVRGAGIFFNGTGGTIRTISETQVSHNEATSSGGGLSNYGGITLNRVSLSGNTAFGNGGGADNLGILVLHNATISANVALYGGGLVNHGNASVTLDHCTVANNVSGGAGRALLADPLSQTKLHNTILASNTIAETCAMLGSLDNQGYNLSIDESCGLSEDAHDLIGVDPMLGVLDNNGGSTLTMALLPDSPAIDHADPTTSQTMDQRGYYRPADGDLIPGAISDIGAFEYDSHLLNIISWLPMLFKP